jgi:pimeloyl-ACP methyl ester carboxylesterase
MMVQYKPVKVDGVNIFFRQAENMKKDGVNIFFRQAENMKKPTILLLHGFPYSSHMFRTLLLLIIRDLEIVTNLQSKG